MGRVLGPSQLHRGEGRSVLGSYVSIWGLVTVLKGTLAMLWASSDTSPCYQNTFHFLSEPRLEPTTLHFRPVYV